MKPAEHKKPLVTVELTPTAFYTLEVLLLLGDGPDLPPDRTLAALLAKVAEIWAQGVLEPDSPAAALMRQVGHLSGRGPLFLPPPPRVLVETEV